MLDREEVADGTMSFYFEKPPGFEYKAGQFADYTLLEPPQTDAEGDTTSATTRTPPASTGSWPRWPGPATPPARLPSDPRLPIKQSVCPPLEM
jgi:hypothetical protein